MAKAIYIQGQEFFRLFVLRQAESYRQPNGKLVRRWHCRCSCGTELAVDQKKLTSGHTRSCGCLQKEVATKHGLKGSITYRSWIAMVQRCTDSNCTAYPLYGGRGISVCSAWRNSFEAFLADMSERPSKRHSLDRIDVNGNYEPINCRWATSREQQRNRRCNKHVIVDGREVTAAEAAELTGLPRGLVYNRLRKGWSVEKVLSKIDYRSRGCRLAVG